MGVKRNLHGFNRHLRVMKREVPISGKRYPEEFTSEAVKQVVDHGHFIAGVATCPVSPLTASMPG
jgi:transposase